MSKSVALIRFVCPLTLTNTASEDAAIASCTNILISDAGNTRDGTTMNNKSDSAALPHRIGAPSRWDDTLERNLAQASLNKLMVKINVADELLAQLDERPAKTLPTIEPTLPAALYRDEAAGSDATSG